MERSRSCKRSAQPRQSSWTGGWTTRRGFERPPATEFIQREPDEGKPATEAHRAARRLRRERVVYRGPVEGSGPWANRETARTPGSGRGSRQLHDPVRSASRSSDRRRIAVSAAGVQQDRRSSTTRRRTSRGTRSGSPPSPWTSPAGRSRCASRIRSCGFLRPIASRSGSTPCATSSARRNGRGSSTCRGTRTAWRRAWDISRDWMACRRTGPSNFCRTC